MYVHALYPVTITATYAGGTPSKAVAIFNFSNVFYMEYGPAQSLFCIWLFTQLLYFLNMIIIVLLFSPILHT